MPMRTSALSAFADTMMKGILDHIGSDRILWSSLEAVDHRHAYVAQDDVDRGIQGSKGLGAVGNGGDSEAKRGQYALGWGDNALWKLAMWYESCRS